MEIRTRNDDDLDACVAVLAEVHTENEYPSNWPADPRGWLTPDGLRNAWVGIVDGAIVGHIAKVGAPENAEVSRLFVAPRARRCGVAAALLDTVVREGGSLWLETVERASAAVSFYQRQGWLLTERAPASWLDRDGEHPMIVRFAAPITAPGSFG